ncbi:MAG: type II toxin-antitoxin system HipA family toxin [Oxalobacter sp.]|nr:type II toxin-antitoxin system HipA family toxin [Oxalobacter sp.]
MVKENLSIAMNGLAVGNLYRHADGAMSFAYTPSWLDRPQSRPVSFSMPLRSQPYEGMVVYNFFENLLPDSQEIISRIQARFQVASSHPFDLLSAVGRDCIGAIQIYPFQESPPPVSQVTAEPLDESGIAVILRSYNLLPLGMDETSDFRISLAGTQEKTALLWHEGTWKRPTGSTPTSHILKLPIGKIAYSNIDLSESCENEWLCLKLAKAFGFPVSEAELMDFDGQKVLVVERFDRRWSSDGKWLMRLPQEDMCQALGIAPANKYEQQGGPGIRDIMTLLLGSDTPEADRKLFFKAQVFYWLLAAIDGHGKNFSIFLNAGGGYSMTPLYDILSAYPLFSGKGLQRQKVKMAMAFTGKNRHYEWHTILPRHFLSTADACGLAPAKAKRYLQEIVDVAEQAVASVSSQLPSGFPAHIADTIFSGISHQTEILRSNV